MASASGQAETQGTPLLVLGSGHMDQTSSHCRGDGVRSPGKGREAGTLSPTREGNTSMCDDSVTVSPHHPHIVIDKQEGASGPQGKEDGGRGDCGWRGVGVVRLDSTERSDSSRAEQRLWQEVEGIMAAKRCQVQQVLEEFGISDVQPSSTQQLEEQVWRVVQGEITLQEAADLV